MPEELDKTKKPKTTLIKHKKIEEEVPPVVQEEPACCPRLRRKRWSW